MVACLFYPDEDYLAALEQACLFSDLMTCRFRLFTEEALWRKAVLSEDFFGVAAAPKSAFEGVALNPRNKMLILTDRSMTESGEISIYDAMDTLNRTVRKLMGEETGEKAAGVHCIFSFQSVQHQSYAFGQLKLALGSRMPAAGIVDFTTMAKVSGGDGTPLSEWLWDGERNVFQEGECHMLYRMPHDTGITFVSDWQDKVIGAVMQTPHPLWFWCGTEWQSLIPKMMPFVKSLSWMCDHPKDVDHAMQWMGMIKSSHSGIAGYLISNRPFSDQEGLRVKRAFDAHFDNLMDYIHFVASGGR